MDTAAQSQKIKRVLRKSGQTAAEIATRLGYEGGGRAVGRTLAKMAEAGEVKKGDERVPTYAKP